MFVNLKLNNKEFVFIFKTIEEIKNYIIKENSNIIYLQISKKNELITEKEIKIEDLTEKEIIWANQVVNNEIRYLNCITT